MLPTPQDERRQFYLMPQRCSARPIIALMTGRRWMRRWPAPRRRAGATVIELAVNETDGAQTLQQLAQVSRL